MILESNAVISNKISAGVFHYILVVLLRTSYPSPFGSAIAVQIVPDDLVTLRAACGIQFGYPAELVERYFVGFNSWVAFLQTKKKQPRGCFLLFGGGGGSRTRVRQPSI